jgi:hypothetical protein
MSCFVTFDVAHTATEEAALSDHFGTLRSCHIHCLIRSPLLYTAFILRKNEFGVIRGYTQLGKILHVALAKSAFVVVFVAAAAAAAADDDDDDDDRGGKERKKERLWNIYSYHILLLQQNFYFDY